ISTLEAQLAAAEHLRDQHAHHCATTIASIQRPGLLTRAGQLFGSGNPAPDRLAMTAQDLRKLADQIQQSRSELYALRHARGLVEAERDYLTGNIATLIARLDTLVPRGHQDRNEPTVIAIPMDAVFADLWEVTADTDDDKLTDVLLGAINHVTENGLAVITGAVPPRLEVIAANIAHHRCVLTPPWGGKPRMLEASAIHVLPPLTRETGEKLTSLIKKHNAASTVIVAEQMPASINCTTLFIMPVNSLEDDIFSQYLRSSLLDAFRDKHPETFFTAGTAALDELGIVIDGQVEFLDKTPTQQRTRR
ncbi:MAG: hypothetical protein ABSA26_16750, partial [Thermoguttaceae bacterium]